LKKKSDFTQKGKRGSNVIEKIDNTYAHPQRRRYQGRENNTNRGGFGFRV